MGEHSLYTIRGFADLSRFCADAGGTLVNTTEDQPNRRGIASLPVLAADLDVVLKHRLLNSNIERVEQLADLTAGELLMLKGIGQCYVRQIREYLADNGLCLRGDSEVPHAR